jgi:hypothetical protein
MPGGSVTKIGRTYKKWTYIAGKQNIQLTKKQHVQLTKNSISHKVSKYSTNATNRVQDTINIIQDTKHRKATAYTETTKHERKEKATAGN